MYAATRGSLEHLQLLLGELVWAGVHGLYLAGSAGMGADRRSGRAAAGWKWLGLETPSTVQHCSRGTALLYGLQHCSVQQV
jgi:hypothetical protein